MDINAINRAKSLSFKERNSDNKEKSNNSLPFVAASAVIGGGIGLLTPERKVFKTVDEITPEHLSNVIKNAAEHTKNFTVEKANQFKKAVNTAFSDIKEAAKTPASTQADASMFGEQANKHFNILKKLAPTESPAVSGARGAAIGGSIAMGLVVTSKLLDELSPPKDIYTDYGKVLPSQKMREYES